MVALINVESSLPRPLWALVRHLDAQPGKKQRTADARAVLSPPSLFDGGDDSQRVFDKALRTGIELGLVNETDNVLTLREKIDREDLSAFYDLLRWRVIARANAEQLVTDPSQTQGKDLLRALCWFLTLGDQLQPITAKTFASEQHKALDEELGNPLRNESRWNQFTYWAPSLGFAEAPLLPPEKGVAGLVPDCTRAVRGAIRKRWSPGTRLDGREFVASLLETLPVLPGGLFSQALGLTSGPRGVADSMAFALQRGGEEGWLKLSTSSDASNGVQFSDPSVAGGIGLFTDVEIGDVRHV